MTEPTTAELIVSATAKLQADPPQPLTPQEVDALYHQHDDTEAEIRASYGKTKYLAIGLCVFSIFAVGLWTIGAFVVGMFITFVAS